MVPRMPGSRATLATAVGALLLLGVGALVVTRDSDEPQQLTAGGTEASSTTLPATTSTTAPALTEPPSTAASTTPTTPATAAPTPTTASSAPTTAPAATSATSGQQLATAAGGHAPVAAALAQARARWASTKPSRGYTWSYDNECFCWPRKLEVTVDGSGAVAIARNLDDGTALKPGVGLSVDAALDELQRAVDNDAASIKVRFDGRGIPVSYRVDLRSQTIDEEHGITLIAFTPRS